MVKVGEGGGAPKSAPMPEKELKNSVAHFKKAFSEYQKEMADAQKTRAMEQMQKQISIMDIAGENVKRKETRVQEQKVSSDFQAFQQDPSEENAAILEHDLNTLRESLEH